MRLHPEYEQNARGTLGAARKAAAEAAAQPAGGGGALECYSEALEQLKPLAHSQGEDGKVKELLHQLLANTALCHTYLERWEEATSSIQEALALDPHSTKYKTRAAAIAEKMSADEENEKDPAEATTKTSGGKAKPQQPAPDEEAVVDRYRCIVCDKKSTLTCKLCVEATPEGAQCAGVKYCDRDCQREHWQEHRREMHPK